MSLNKRPDLQRRRLVQGAGAAILSGVIGAPMIIPSRKAFAASNLILVSWGGNYQRVIEEVYVKPFEKEFGVRVTIVSTPDLAKVKAQMMTGNVEWDVFEGTGAMTFSGSKNGYWEPLDPALFKSENLIAPITKDAVPIEASCGGICWDNSKFPDGKHPETFIEYFDVGKFPGPRTLRNRPSETLEIALLADGVPPDQLYPLDVDRAFRSLDRIKPHIAHWVEQTPQTGALVKTGEVDFSYTYPGIMLAAQNPAKSLRFSFKQNLLFFNYLSVMKNAPNKANAVKYLQFVLRPDRQSALANAYFGIVPSSRAAVQSLTSEARKWQPDLDNKMNVKLNDNWWSDHFDQVTQRFKEWQLS
ncbi:ABC transporter substrate-binding protein [Bradyrhizobium sp. 14AA]